MFIKVFLKYLINPGIQHLLLHVTHRCPLRCRHCFAGDPSAQELGLPDFQRIGKEMGKLFWLDIGGGEPFLRSDLPEIVRSFDAEMIQIPTSGFLPGQIREIARRLLGQPGKITVSISIDGLKETHNLLRDHPQSWDKAWQTFEFLRALPGLLLKINTVLTAQNADEIFPLMDEVWSRNPDFHSIILLRGNSRDPHVRLPPLEKVESMRSEILSRQQRYGYGQGSRLMQGVLRNYHGYLWDTSMKILREKRQVVPCLGGKAHLVIYPNGEVAHCEMLPAVGSIQGGSVKEILRSRAFRLARREIRRGACFCTHNCALLDSILFRPASYFYLLSPFFCGGRS